MNLAQRVKVARVVEERKLEGHEQVAKGGEKESGQPKTRRGRGAAVNGGRLSLPNG